MSESFEDALVTIHKYRLLSDKMCDRLKKAHEHDMKLTRHTYDLALAQARDPQRLRGAKPDTFDGAIEALWEFRWQHATNNKDVIPYINAVKDAHDHEIEQMRTEIMRLRSTPVYNESCSESYLILREQIKTNCENDPNVWVETLTLGALEAYGEAVEQRIQHIRKAEYHRGYEDGQRSMDAGHRAVCHKLRRVVLDGDSHTMLSRLAYAIYPCATGWTGESCEGLRERIIELMGGVHDGVSDHVSGRACGDGRDNRDGQSEAVGVDDSVSDGDADVSAADGVGDLAAAQVTYDELGNERHKAVCELRKLRTSYDGGDDDLWKWLEELYAALGDSPLYLCSMGNIKNRLIHLLGGDEPTLRDSQKSPILADSDGEDGGEVTITDELREWYRTTPYLGKGSFELCAIADRIDKQFARVCEQQETVLQDTIDDAADECDRLIGECNELQAKLEEADAAIANYREREKSFAESERLRDELQEKLDAIREMLDE